LLAVGCTGGGSDDPGPTAAVERGRIERIVVATGTVEPEKDLEVRPRIAGIIETIHVEAGDRVERNQPLVEIERELLEAQVREAEAGLRDARVEQRYAKIALQRLQELERGGAASQQKRDEASSRFERAEAGVARAQARLQTLSTQSSRREAPSPRSRPSPAAPRSSPWRAPTSSSSRGSWTRTRWHSS
jgi:multidrug efflux pump subunit AcrA (membrane-fusion protein)